MLKLSVIYIIIVTLAIPRYYINGFQRFFMPSGGYKNIQNIKPHEKIAASS